MIDGMEPWLPFLLISAIVLAAGFVQSAIGFGYGVTGLAMLPLVIDPHTSHLLISTSGVPVLIAAAWVWRGEPDWKLLGFSLLGAITFMPFGFWLFGVMSLDSLVRVTGLAIIVMVFLSLKKSSLATKTTSRKSSFLAGACGGFFSGAVSIAGPPIAAFAMRQSWPPRKFKAFVVQCLLLIALFRLTGLFAAGLLTPSILLQAASAVPFAITGVGLGMVATSRIEPHRFRAAVATLLVLVACQLMYRGSPSVHSTNETTSSETSNNDTSNSIGIAKHANQNRIQTR